MECPVDTAMTITGVTHAKWYGAPAPMFCGPKTTQQPFTGFWDHNYECKWVLLLLASWARGRSFVTYFCNYSLSLPGNKGWANPPESCDVYEGQKAGRFDTSSRYANSGE